MRYELFYLVGASKEVDLEKIKGEMKEVVTSHGGVLEEKETMEKRKLAYKIQKDLSGFYVAIRFELEDSQKVVEIREKLNLYTDILRFIITRADELPELKTKEERLQSASKERRPDSEKPVEKAKEKVEKKKEEEKPAEVKETEEIKKEEKIKDIEDIDEKLEEILNI